MIHEACWDLGFEKCESKRVFARVFPLTICKKKIVLFHKDFDKYATDKQKVLHEYFDEDGTPPRLQCKFYGIAPKFKRNYSIEF